MASGLPRHGGVDPHRHGSRDASFAPFHRWRGTAHRVLLRNPYADIGLTCLDGQAAVWIGERIDRDYRIRCEWSDVSGRPATGSPASRRLSRPVPSASAYPHQHSHRSALARSRLIAFLQEIPMSRLPTSGEWREGSLGRTTADWPFDWVAEITAIDPLTHSYTCIGTVRQAGARRYDEAMANLRLMARAPAMLRILQAVAHVLK
jgi:hypothetical protein